MSHIISPSKQQLFIFRHLYGSLYCAFLITDLSKRHANPSSENTQRESTVCNVFRVFIHLDFSLERICLLKLIINLLVVTKMLFLSQGQRPCTCSGHLVVLSACVPFIAIKVIVMSHPNVPRIPRFTGQFSVQRCKLRVYFSKAPSDGSLIFLKSTSSVTSSLHCISRYN